MPKFFDGGRAQKLYAALDLLRRFSERAESLFISSGRGCRIRNAPMGNGRLAREDGTRFLCPVANRNDNVEMRVFELVPRLAARVLGADFV